MQVANINCIHYKNGNCLKFGKRKWSLFHPTCKLIEHQPCGYQEKHYNPINHILKRKETNMPVKVGDELEVKIDLEEMLEKEVTSFEMFKVVDSTGERDMTDEEKMKFCEKMDKMRKGLDKLDRIINDIKFDSGIEIEGFEKVLTLQNPNIKISFF